MGGIYSELASDIWARELGAQSEVFAEVLNASLNTKYAVTIFPPVGFAALIPHKFTFALPLTSERGDPRAAVGALTTTATTYDTVASLAVGARPRRGELLEISLNSSDLTKTNWQLTIGGTQQFTGRVILATLTLPFRRGFLTGAQTVLVEAASTDGTSITANASITIREYTPYEWQIWVYKKGQVSEEHTAYLTDDIIRDGVGSWVYLTKTSPLHVEVEKLYGRSGDHILIYAWSTKVPSQRNLEEIKRLATARGIPEVMPLAR